MDIFKERNGYISMVIMIKGFEKPNCPVTMEGLGWSNSKGIQIDLRTLRGKGEGRNLISH